MEVEGGGFYSMNLDSLSLENKPPTKEAFLNHYQQNSLYL